MLKKTMVKALNEQINAELYSSYLYLAMAAYCESKDLAGMATWFKVQAQEELVHAMKLFNYVLDRDGQVSLGQIDAPQSSWKTALNVFESTLEHEQGVTARINKLANLAAKEGDNTTWTFLQWFVNEQIEEEASARKIIGQLRLMGDSGSGIFMLDRELATRTFVMPAATPAA